MLTTVYDKFPERYLKNNAACLPERVMLDVFNVHVIIEAKTWSKRTLTHTQTDRQTDTETDAVITSQHTDLTDAHST